MNLSFSDILILNAKNLLLKQSDTFLHLFNPVGSSSMLLFKFKFLFSGLTITSYYSEKPEQMIHKNSVIYVIKHVINLKIWVETSPWFEQQIQIIGL